MADQVASATNSDTPPVNGSDITHDGLPATFQFVNGMDVSADFILEGTYGGDDFSDAVQLSSTTVSNGTTDSVRLDEEWDLLRVTIDNFGAATSGTAEAYRHRPRKR